MKRGGASVQRENLSRLTTERPNRASADLDLKSALEVLRVINAEDAKVVDAVRRALPQIARAVDLIANALQRGGRLIYVGAGTSGRIAALDAAECPPTFNVDPRTVQFVMAGGPAALASAGEADEDSRELGRREMAKRKPGRNDVVVGIAASGRTPFTLAAIEYARGKGAHTISVTCNRNTPMQRAARLAIVTQGGAGSDFRVDPHESRHGAEDGAEHALQRGHDAAGIRLRKPHDQRHSQKFETGGAQRECPRAGGRGEPGSCTQGFTGGGKQRSGGAGHAAGAGRPPGSGAGTQGGRWACAAGHRWREELVAFFHWWAGAHLHGRDARAHISAGVLSPLE